jgi:sulfite reductase alpha subunit-like flavoprotein
MRRRFQYNAVARRLHARLVQLGAQPLITPLASNRGLGNDQSQYGFWSDLDPWLSLLWQGILAKFPLPPAYTVDDAPRLEAPKYKVEWLGKGAAAAARAAEERAAVADGGGHEDAFPSCFFKAPAGAYPTGRADGGPFRARVLANRRLTAPEWSQDVRCLELEIHMPVPAPASESAPASAAAAGGGPWPYQAGDVAVLHPENACDIDAFARALGLDADAAFTVSAAPPRPGDGGDVAMDIPSPCTVRRLLRRFLDIQGTPRRYFFERMSLFVPEGATAEEEEERLEVRASATCVRASVPSCERDMCASVPSCERACVRACVLA